MSPKKKATKKPITKKVTKKATSKKVNNKKKAAPKATAKAKTKKMSNPGKKKKPTPKKPVAKKAPVKKAAVKKTPTKKPAPAKDPKKEEMLLDSRKRKATPSIFKIRARKATPIVFSLEDVRELIKTKPKETAAKAQKAVKAKAAKKVPARKATKQPVSKKKRVLGAASLSDILGFNPNDAKSRPRAQIEESKIPKPWMKFYKALINLRDHVKEGLDLHTKDTLKRSSKDDTGDLSSYSQHMADAGTDTFDRDFALNLLSNEQDALFEIEEAIQRIIDNNYGSCEITGRPINKERLMAVPFTRYSLEGQKQLEATPHKARERGGVFAESSLEDSAKYTEDYDG